MGVALVLDASAGVELLLDTPIGRALTAQIPAGATWWAPEHYFAEVAAVLRRHELRGLVTSTRAVSAFGDLYAAHGLRRVQVRPLLVEAWALRQNMTIADALYVVLAQHLRATLVTGDLRLVKAAPVPVIHP